MDECPICTDELTGSTVNLGCCKKSMHVECLIKCMKQKLNCPMCRAHHESLRIVQDVESQVFVPIQVNRNKNFFRDFVVLTLATSIFVVSFYKFY